MSSGRSDLSGHDITLKYYRLTIIKLKHVPDNCPAVWEFSHLRDRYPQSEIIIPRLGGLSVLSKQSYKEGERRETRDKEGGERENQLVILNVVFFELIDLHLLPSLPFITKSISVYHLLCSSH